MSIRPITDVLRDLRFGEALDEASDAFNALVQAVESTGKAGELTITLKLKPSTAGAIEVTDDIKAKVPKLAKGSSLFFATPEGNLVKNDPRQMSLAGLKEVTTPETRPLKDATHG